jgi:hypothetical protein
MTAVKPVEWNLFKFKKISSWSEISIEIMLCHCWIKLIIKEKKIIRVKSLNDLRILIISR